ncbi:MAG TPA: FtsK/SpoIIIE domain-containing protein [Jatrophihabitans sp.]|nr:FtsK/SpoIIIE domain-containing protein [Jatrophihabitans sp.]
MTWDRSALLSEAVGLAEVGAEAVRRRWRSRSSRPTAPIGISGDRTFEIDLAADGPHLLVAGTTGSGKSELLRVLITSLALRNPPTELTFVLVDYKGGAAFAECAELPHVTGVVTDLDPHRTRRALAALNAELRRREEAFAHAGISEFADYQHSGNSLDNPLARLVLIVDEFAALAERMPELLTGLLSVAQRGRSLGVHLVLATQRPAGVLSADIKANIGLRIALRMADAAESVDVVGVDTASRISRGTPGLAIARHADGQLVEFQTACVSQPATPADVIAITELDEWNRPRASPADPDQPTELTILKRAVVAAAAGMPRPTPPWLDPLPEILCVEPTPGSGVVVFGRSDEPAESRQAPVSLDLVAGGALGLIGGPRSGRTTALRTIIGVAIGQLTPDRLHVYAIDCAGAALRPLQQIPHCGAVLDTTEPAAVPRLIARLAGEHRRRQQLLAEHGAADFAEGLAIGYHLPAILVALDGWDRMCNLSDEVDGGRSAELIGQLLREGAATGFSFAITGDRGVLGTRIGSALSRRLLLPLADRNDYAAAGVEMAAVPRTAPPGRAVTAEDGIEVQIGLLAEDPSSAAQWDSLRARALSRTTGFSAAGRPPTTEWPVAGDARFPAEPGRLSGPTIRMRPLPAAVDAGWLLAQHEPDGHCLLGVGRDDASVIGCPLLDPHRRFLIAGPDASGRSTAAILIARQARSRGLRILAAAPARSGLAAWAAENRIITWRPEDLLDDIDAELLVIDDAEQFTDTAAGSALQAWIAHTDASVVATARTPDVLNSFRGIGPDLRRHRSGLLLQPCATDGEIFGVRLPQLPPSGIAGRGVLVTRETRDGVAGYEPIQVAA